MARGQPGSESLGLTFTRVPPTPTGQILPPTEVPKPIKAPTIQVLEYGEALALYNFRGELPVELSFRKVPPRRTALRHAVPCHTVLTHLLVPSAG